MTDTLEKVEKALEATIKDKPILNQKAAYNAVGTLATEVFKSDMDLTEKINLLLPCVIEMRCNRQAEFVHAANMAKLEGYEKAFRELEGKAFD